MLQKYNTVRYRRWDAYMVVVLFVTECSYFNLPWERIMKKSILAVTTITALALGGSAMAADSWTGLYLNGGGGYGGWSADTTTVNATTGVCYLCSAQTQGGSGGLGTIGIGYDYQFMNKIVAGILADYDFSSLQGTIQDQLPFYAGSIKQESAWAAGARVGWLLSPATLGYLNGGYSKTSFSGTTQVTTFQGMPAGNMTPSFDKGGWFMGVGLEAGFASHWSLRTEYRFAKYDSTTIPDTGKTLEDSITFKPAVQTGTIQVVYKF